MSFKLKIRNLRINTVGFALATVVNNNGLESFHCIQGQFFLLTLQKMKSPCFRLYKSYLGDNFGYAI